jgi:hypothetical protein
MKLDPWTISIDLTKRFQTQNLEFNHLAKKSPGIPLLSQFGIWKDSGEDAIYTHGGQFYGGIIWNRSSYYVNKADIPPYSIWKLNITSKSEGWREVTGEGNSKVNFNRTFGGTFASVPDLDLSYYIGLVL